MRNRRKMQQKYAQHHVVREDDIESDNSCGVSEKHQESIVYRQTPTRNTRAKQLQQVRKPATQL